MIGKPISKAYMGVNQRYLQIEGATDRRTRTSSVALKKNAQLAPTVQAVPTGCSLRLINEFIECMTSDND